MGKLLYNSKDIKNQLTRLFSNDNDSKIVITAFIGTGAKKYVPYNTNNLTIYCWDKDGITNPFVIEEYLKKGATVYFVDKLHSKIYYCENKGAIIGSANLTDNALGDSGLIETAIYDINVSNRNINKIIDQFGKIKQVKLGSKILEEKKEIYQTFQRRTPTHAANNKDLQNTFDKWYTENNNYRFKILLCYPDGALTRNERAEIKENNPEKKICDFFNVEKTNTFKKGLFILSANYTKTNSIYLNDIHWSIVDYKTEKSLMIV